MRWFYDLLDVAVEAAAGRGFPWCTGQRSGMFSSVNRPEILM